MTLADQIAADVADVLLNTEEHAESVTHRPLGNAAADAAVTAVVQFDEPQIEHDRGRKVLQRGVLFVADSLALAETDRWRIRGKFYDIERIGVAEAGLVAVHVVDRKAETTTAAGRMSR